MKYLASLAIIVLLSIHSSAHSQDTDWNQWRGPKRDGTINIKLPENLEDVQLSWEVSLQPSYSGPVTQDGFVFTTATVNKQYEEVYCYSEKTGKLVWTSKWNGAMTVPFFAAANGSWIRSTPLVADGKLFVGGMRDVLTCLNVEDGKILWQKDFVKELKSPIPSFGFASSPIYEDGKVVVQAGSGVIQLDAENGNILWQASKDQGGMNGSAFSSPTIEVINGKPQLVVQTREELVGLGWKSGEKLWGVKIPAFRGMNILTPIRYKNSFFTSSYGGGSFLYDLAGEKIKPESSWNNTIQAYMSSPVVLGDHAYMHLRNQRLICLNLKNGETAWTSQPFGKYWSMITDGERILGLDQKGVLYLIDGTPESLEILSQKKVSDTETWAHVAINNGNIYIRSLNKLMCYSMNQTSDSTETAVSAAAKLK
ncbi:MAG: pyrrolo-quinoline quinone [Planctomycetaceae bacterium]|nr:pyrrolo-quinoline quinone [Planctomycetaceae bacterium]|tara:strand:+ start:2992 stop:4263 length:1272 start_codon:yes stop_codon:yes gene_type:complete